MQEMDRIEIVVEKECYVKDGIHKGMQGWICDSRSIDETWLVNFPQYGENEDIATISVKGADMKRIDKMDAKINECIKVYWDNQKKINRSQ